ncbi:uncharacterized protein ACA1_325550 [Acanthamoeba castellanii str. Neff]|jgi:hypothetical protein|uniref:Lipoprotein n=1 Tax=Acanthamoeba castellanii (strain ATCC 30010 / Neff) TaxID=1257118 RepID=L8HB74_ACACF|nr:uncharacterized protein ACA1_325550 [Acanthamoeba castellanii str. Neff]ELR21983.1 hypothetical protein ACA1_325550 [Acanthamoeba castellanii str. Neff]
MQRKLALTLLVCLACIACCHAWKQIVVPEKPTLPPAFSAAVHVQRNYKPYQEYFRWFRDEKLQKARVDRLAEVHGETLFHSFIYDHSEQKMFAVFFRGEVATCFTKTIRGNLTHFDLSEAEFLGKSYVYFDPVYHWQLETDRYHFELFDTPEPHRELRKVSFFIKPNGKAGSWTMHEFDAGSQDESLFMINDKVKQSCTPYHGEAESASLPSHDHHAFLSLYTQ